LHDIQTWFKQCEMTWFNKPSTFIKIKNHLDCFYNTFVFFSTHLHYIYFHKYIQISHFMKWNEMNFFFPNIMLRLHYNIICKNLMKIFQKFEVGYIQTCTSLESNRMWHPKGGHHSVLSPMFLTPSMFPTIGPWMFFSSNGKFKSTFLCEH